MAEGTDSVVLQTVPLGAQWPTIDPFLFCAHHDDAYPAGNDEMGPEASLDGRRIGQDFAGIDGWNMYHGTTVPGFPQHPHRGFETVTFVRKGLVDHADSMGAHARFGRGDVQWMTAGQGVVHSEMFPLLDRAGSNPLEMFQVWLNLPGVDKLVDPYFTMLWDENLPKHRHVDGNGRATDVTIIAGSLLGSDALAPPPNSWAARADADVAMWHIRVEPDGSWTLPAAAVADTVRTLYLFEGDSLTISGTTVGRDTGSVLRCDVDVRISAGASGAECLLLQGRPIGEPVAKHGPFVMNTDAEIRQTFADYQSTGFGGWPWPSEAPTHGRDTGRFASHGDGRTEGSAP